MSAFSTLYPGIQSRSLPRRLRSASEIVYENLFEVEVLNTETGFRGQHPKLT
jgi:hypothetical protein